MPESVVCTLVKVSVVVSEEVLFNVVLRTTAPFLYQVTTFPVRLLLLEHMMLTMLPDVTTPPPAADRLAVGQC